MADFAGCTVPINQHHRDVANPLWNQAMMNCPRWLIVATSASFSCLHRSVQLFALQWKHEKCLQLFAFQQFVVQSLSTYFGAIGHASEIFGSGPHP